MQSDDEMLKMYGYIVDALHHTPSDTERSLHVVPGSHASAQSVVEEEHIAELRPPYSNSEFIRKNRPVKEEK